jgi:hypothetical protein
MRVIPAVLLSFSALGIAALPARAAVVDPIPGFSGKVRAQLAAWEASCADSPDGASVCALPEAIPGAEAPIELPLRPTSGPSTLGRSVAELPIALPQSEPLRVRLTLYSVEPALEAGQPLYVQAKLEVDGPFHLVCAQSVRWQVPFELPPLICGGRAAGATRQLGVTARFSWSAG